MLKKIYKSAKDILITADTTLYAVWTRNGQAINGGTSGDSTNSKTGDTAQPLLYALVAGSALLASASLLILRRRLKRD